MTLLTTLFRRDTLFPLVIGPMDGMLTALTFAAGHLFEPGHPVDTYLMVRIAVAAAASGGFVFFVAEYARLRGELVHAEQHLTLTRARRLAQSHLGATVLFEAFRGALVATVSSFVGALLPAILGMLFAAAWTTPAIAVIILGLLGVVIARAARGNPIYWAAGAMITGVLVTAIGVFLDIT
jgi:predicted membrane protein (TIGR00267 family)